ncbi:MAG: hypothetical protein ACLFRO_04415 [Desulfobacterales bacterium]
MKRIALAMEILPPPIAAVPGKIPRDITRDDEIIFQQITSRELSDEEQTRIKTPPRVCSRQGEVLAVHWHPEFIPLDLILQRIHAMFPNRREELIIPTQHNVLMHHGPYTGVEVDCYSRGFNQKVQLLIHFKNENLEQADIFKAMLAHTFQYRSGQLFDFIHSITRPVEERIAPAAAETGSGKEIVEFVRIYVKKIETLLERHESELSEDAVKNKLLRDFFDQLRPVYGDRVISRAQTFLKAVKQLVKAHFPTRYFYRTSEIIEEARALGGGIVIPHPEQFWPILLAGYDVDGIEVWNPQSRRYTEFLISVLNEKNQRRRHGEIPLLIFMGDDTHMGEKRKEPDLQDPDKARREIGLQPAWDDLKIRKQLIFANTSRRKVIREYIQRLAG